MSRSKALGQMVKWELGYNGTHYDLYIDGHFVMSLRGYNEIVSKSRPRTYDQVLIGEALEVLYYQAFYEFQPDTVSSSLGFLYNGAYYYYDLKSTFRRSRKAGKAKALALAKRLHLDDFNRAIQASTWVKNSHSSGVLEMKLLEDQWNHQYSLRFSDGVDSITVKKFASPLEWFCTFWFFKTKKFKEMISVLNNAEWIKVASSLHGAEKESLLRALELTLRCGTTLGTALFLTARE